ncbi:FtsL-like putative cell division protein [Flavobacterium sp.]|uniref:FtsL-like putative cell division protein n=1 Tax=Flavobacterium sp. TaxID=239 RepID=UPI00262CCEF9|nr:FtsL-like putative cell division protein [Flavobacterium sp.]MDD3004837.1 FtsL-like putative cell division protein [Flavobacterium sp.]
MKGGIYNVLKARFLVDEDANRNWGFILFVILLAIIMIANTNSYERKIFTIKALESEVKELRSEFVDRRSELMELKLESTIEKKMLAKEIKPSSVPPVKIKVKAPVQDKNFFEKLWQ